MWVVVLASDQHVQRGKDSLDLWGAFPMAAQVVPGEPIENQLYRKLGTYFACRRWGSFPSQPPSFFLSESRLTLCFMLCKNPVKRIIVIVRRLLVVSLSLL
jgi:hypothetical protein